MKVKLIIANSPVDGFNFNVLGKLFYAYVPFTDDLTVYRTKICYAIQTSGTTGTPKTVLVPDGCIMPNVDYFM